MKILLLFFSLCVFYTGTAQVDILTSTNWRLTGLTINSQNIEIPPPNSEVDKILLTMLQDNIPTTEDFTTVVCDILTSGDDSVIYDEVNSSFTLPDLIQSPDGCVLGKNEPIQLAYFGFFYDNLKTPFTFSIVKLSGTNVLDILVPNGDRASYQENLLTVESQKAISFKIYPNPVNNNLLIDTALNIEAITIYTISGQKIGTYKTKTIDTSQLTAGIYFIEVQTNGQKSVQRFIKQ